MERTSGDLLRDPEVYRGAKAVLLAVRHLPPEDRLPACLSASADPRIGRLAATLLASSGETRITDRWQLDRVLTSGESHTVFAGSDVNTSVGVVVKVARGQARSRLGAEVEVLKVLGGRVAPECLDAGVTGHGNTYLVRQHRDGLPIHLYFRTNRLTLRQRAAAAIRTFAALESLHGSGVAHRSLTPWHVLLNPDDVTFVGWSRARTGAAANDGTTDVVAMGRAVLEAATGRRITGGWQPPAVDRFIAEIGESCRAEAGLPEPLDEIRRSLGDGLARLLLDIADSGSVVCKTAADARICLWRHANGHPRSGSKWSWPWRRR